MYHTSIEQSKKLLDLGLDAETHDMFYRQDIGRKTDMPYYDVQVGHSVAVEQNLFSFRKGYEIPCWSVGKLIDLMPIIGRFNPFAGKFDGAYHCSYLDGDGESMKDFLSETSLMEACVLMMEWLLTSGNMNIKTQI